MRAQAGIFALAGLALLWGAAAAETPPPSAAEPVALVADEVTFDEGTGVLTARGNVEMFQNGRTLTAAAVRYDSRSGRVAAEGPIVLRDAGGETLFADSADLDPSLRDGLAMGARAVIAGGGKLAAAEAERVGGRYTVLTRAVFSPCEVCAARPVPLWRIRAERIVHDQEERFIHYENAWFDVAGVPVGFLPYFRHPSPEVERADGFLAPDLSRDPAYGVGVKLPVFVTLGNHADATFTPFLVSEDGAILETEYRRRFARGFLDLDLKLGLTDYDDDFEGTRFRVGGFGSGRYRLTDKAHAGFDLAFSGDDPFLRRYDFTEDDRLTSAAFVRYYDGRDRASVETAFLQSLRDNDPQGAIPMVLPEISARKVLDVPGLGGELGLGFDSVSLVREEGRDVARVSLGADWSRDWLAPGGVVLTGFADVRADFYRIEDDPVFEGEAARFLPRIGAEARWPLVRADAAGRTHVAEPVVQFSVSPDVDDGDIPNEDSVTVEFDEMNLFEHDRATGFDRPEQGTNLTLGGRYEMIDDDGLGFRAAGGRVLRFDETLDFPAAAGLDGDASDWVASGTVTYADWLDFTARWRLSDGFEVERAEAGGSLAWGRAKLSGYYLFLEQDPAEGSPLDRSEVAVAASLALDRNWTVGGDARRDLIEDRFVNAGGVLSYEDECAALDFYVRRQFTESFSSPRSTSFGVRVRLFGAGAAEPSRASGACAFGAD